MATWGCSNYKQPELGKKKTLKKRILFLTPYNDIFRVY